MLCQERGTEHEPIKHSKEFIGIKYETTIFIKIVISNESNDSKLVGFRISSAFDVFSVSRENKNKNKNHVRW